MLSAVAVGNVQDFNVGGRNPAAQPVSASFETRYADSVNAVLHGNAYDANKTVKASFETTPEALTIHISDQGPGLDPDTIPDPLAPENILRGSGRGIFLIRAFMDEVKFRQLHPGTELTLIKHRPPAQSGT